MSTEIQLEVAHQEAANGEADTWMEDGVAESLCDVAIQGHWLLADYLLFTGRIRCTTSEGAVEEPIGTVGTALKTWRLAPGAVDESHWDVFPRRELPWEDVCRLSRLEVRMAASVAIQNAEVHGQVVDLFIRESVRSFIVPDELACDREFLEDPAEAAYVENMNHFLLLGVGRHPLMTDERSRNIVVREMGSRQLRTSFALLAGTGRLVSFQDYTYFREPAAHETDVRMSGRFEDRTRLLIPFDEFPKVPKCVAIIITPRGLAVRCPRIAYYSGAVVETQDASVKKRYATSYELEWAHAVAASSTAELVLYNRVWVCEERCLEFLHKFESFDDFVVHVVGHEIALVSFRGLVSLLTRARGLSKSFLHSRLDYPSATSVSWAIVRPGSSKFVLPGVWSSVHGGAMGRSPLDAVVPDAVLRSVSSWKMAV